MIMSARNVAVADYGASNLRSICGALRDAGATVKVVTSPSELRGVSKVVVPGVGAFKSGMQSLESTGLREELARYWKAQSGVVLGICLGMQLMFSRSTEGGVSQGLGVLEGSVDRLKVDPITHPLPHMGWNSVIITKKHPLVADLPEEFDAYFAHSYAVEPHDRESIVGHTEYGVQFPAIIVSGNVMATQFHPEKSGRVGMQLLKNFVSL